MSQVASGPTWYVYLVRCGDGSLYTGISTAPERRLAAHARGRGARYTRGRGPLTLAYVEAQPGRAAALRREREVKAWSHERKEALAAGKRRVQAGSEPGRQDEGPSSEGVLYLCPTPVGNLEDITRRAERVLAEADLVLAEDTRRSAVLLRHLGVRPPVLSFHEGNERRRLPLVLRELAAGKRVALVSDAGSPLLSDPGYPLVREAIARGFRVEALPGPTALVPALTASGLPPHPFRFVGFLPRTRARRMRLFEEVRSDAATLVAYEAPHRIRAALEDALTVLGDRRACVAREISKVHETYHRGRLSELLVQLPERPVGEMVLVLAGARNEGAPDPAGGNATGTEGDD
ncbi:MAG: 16S rRNA (cytidine(1402)-2'-O)-methyltransferase [Firmicutes bacterium]|nr:16S rRNA (cytidine(1402)-2'-O)-methyltransferase [Bacillota bacterium]